MGQWESSNPIWLVLVSASMLVAADDDEGMSITTAQGPLFAQCRSYMLSHTIAESHSCHWEVSALSMNLVLKHCQPGQSNGMGRVS